MLVQNQWQELFSCMISKAATIDVISSGDGASKDGAIQLVSNSVIYFGIIWIVIDRI